MIAACDNLFATTIIHCFLILRLLLPESMHIFYLSKNEFHTYAAFTFAVFCLPRPPACANRKAGNLRIGKPVEVIVDQWGIPPIYAQMEADLFLHRDGASFRMLINTGNWDHCLGTNNPGQAGDPEDPNYRNLFNLWATDQYFPVFHSREKVESIEVQRLILEGQLR